MRSFLVLIFISLVSLSHQENVRIVLCFSRNSRVELQNGSQVQVNQLKSGDMVKTYDLPAKQAVFSRFVDFMHYDPSIQAEFVRISSQSGATIELSEYHLIQHRLTNSSQSFSEYAFAKDVREGDLIFLNPSGDEFLEDKVISVNLVQSQGAYAPLTEHGTILVNNILASCYSNVYSHQLAHAVMKPYILWSNLVATKPAEHNPTKSYMNLYAKVLENALKQTPFYSSIIAI